MILSLITSERKIFRVILVLLLFWYLSFTSFSQQIRHIGVDEGLSGIQSFSVQQDKNGFIWIATRFGLDRFDGKTIKHYPLPIINNGQNPIRLTHVILDSDASLWAYTDRGTFYKYDELRDEFVCYKDLDIYLRDVYFDSKNRIWIGARSFFAVLQKDGTLDIIKTDVINDKEVKALRHFDEAHFLLVLNREIYKYDIETGALTLLLSEKLLQEKNLTIESVYFDKKNNRIWIGGTDQGLFLYNLSTNELSVIENTLLLSLPILSIADLNEKYLLIGTDGAGLCMLNKNTGESEKMFINDKKSRIEGDGIYDIYKDKESNIWISSFSDGVYMLDFRDPGFHTIMYEENNDNNLINKVVCDILCDSDGNLWFATIHGLNRWDKKTNVWQKLLVSKNVLCLFEDSSNNIWVGTYSSGAYVLNKRGDILRNYINLDRKDDGIGTNYVYTINEDAQGNIWLGGKKGRISKLDIRTNRFTQFPISQANYIVPFKGDEMLVATESGIFKVVPEGDKYIQYRFNKNLKSSYINDIYIESDTVIWLATYGAGLNRYNLDTREMRAFTRHEGLASDIIYAMIKDANYLWMSSENGLIQFNLSDYTVTNYTKENGISSNKFRQLSKMKDLDGNLYFGSFDGVTYFNPKDIKKEKSAAKIYFQDLYLFNRIVKQGNKNSPLKNSLNNTTHIKLSYRQHSFSINFTTLDFSSQESRRYMWKLDGLDDEWIGPTSENIANYTNIGQGKYTFIVRSIGDNNIILDERQIEIEVVPPFWNTPIARILFFIAALLAIYMVYTYVKQRLRKKHAEEKMQFFIHTAHEIRTPLTLISAPLYQLKEEVSSSKRVDYLLDLVTNNLKKLNDTFSQLLDFQRSYEFKDQLRIKEYNVNDYLIGKTKQWQQAAQKKLITLNLELPNVVLNEWFDSDKMDKIVDNLLSNALKYTSVDGKIIIRLITNAKCWEIRVIDNGIGISRNDRKNLFQRFYRAGNAVNSKETGSGLGLLLVKRYVSLHHGEIGVDSVENKGSEFYIRLKHGKEHFVTEMQLEEKREEEILNAEMNDYQEKEARHRTKILIVEDNDDLRTFLKISFEHIYHVFVARDGKEAWDNIPKINPDIVISDYQMPLMDGFELTKKIKTTFETSHIPVILLTVVTDKKSVETGFHIGVDDYIEKPFDIKYLQIKIDNIIQNRKIIQAKFLGIDKSAPDISENELNNKFLEQVTKIVEDNISNSEFSISEFSKELGLSKSLLYTKFNAITGYTPNDFIKIMRMKKAIEHFREKKYSINEVAFMVGFEDPAYFSNCFKKIYGMSPKQFIEKNIKTDN